MKIVEHNLNINYFDNSKFLNTNLFVKFKYCNPYTNTEVTRIVSLTTADKFKIALATLVGLLLGGVGAPILFFYTARKLRDRQIQEIKNVHLPDDKVTLATIQRFFGREFAIPEFVEMQLQPNDLPLEWHTIDANCKEVTLHVQLMLNPKSVIRYEKLITLKCQSNHHPLTIEKIQASYKEKIDALHKEFLASPIVFKDQKISIKAIGLMIMKDGTWGYIKGERRGYANRQAYHFRTQHACGLNFAKDLGKYKEILEMLGKPKLILPTM